MNGIRFKLNAGASSILVIFVVLCLSTFAALSAASAHADYVLTGKTAQKTSEYYTASGEAEARLAQIDALLLNCLTASASVEDYLPAAHQALQEMDGVQVIISEDETTVSFSVACSESQELQVTIRLLPPQEGGALYQITTYQTVSTVEWEASEQVPILGANK